MGREGRRGRGGGGGVRGLTGRRRTGRERFVGPRMEKAAARASFPAARTARSRCVWRRGEAERGRARRGGDARGSERARRESRERLGGARTRREKRETGRLGRGVGRAVGPRDRDEGRGRRHAASRRDDWKARDATRRVVARDRARSRDGGAERRTCLAPKFTIEGVSRLDSVLRTTSMPLRRARATTLLALPKSIPTTDILSKCADGRETTGRAFSRSRSRSDRV